MDFSPRYQQFRDLLKQIRVDADLTQVELAQKLGKPQSYVSKIEQGERGIDFLETMDFCDACGISVEAFISKLDS